MPTLTFPAMGTLSAGINNSVATITISAWQWLWPSSDAFTILIGSEKMTVTAGHKTTTLTVTRAAGGTTAASHLSAAPITWIVFPATRVFDGTTVFNATDAFLQTMVTSGPAFVIGCPALQTNDDHTRHSQWITDCKLYFGVPQASTQSLIDLVSLLEQIKTLLFLQATFGTSAPAGITDMSWRAPQIDYLQAPAIGMVDISVHTKG